MRKSIFSLLGMFLMGTQLAQAGITASLTLPESGKPEHVYTIKNDNDYYSNQHTAPTKDASRAAQFAFYAGSEKDAYYLYNITAKKWVSYTKADSYSGQTGFIVLTDTKTEGACFKFRHLGDNAYEFSPYQTSGVAPIYINWFKGVGPDNPENGRVSWGLWTDNGARDRGSRWHIKEFGVEHEYTLFSDGMPSDAVVTINGHDFRGLNAQGSHKIKTGELKAEDVKVKVGGGYAAKVSVDNINYQVDVAFVQLFLPAKYATEPTAKGYLLKMPTEYVKMEGNNLKFTAKRGEADRFVFVEKEQGKYYIYDRSAKSYIYYTSMDNGRTVKTTNESNVRYTADSAAANTWQLMMLSESTVAIVPGERTDLTTHTPAWNFTGGTREGCVLNLYRADDRNSAWQIMDASIGSLACATHVFAMPGEPFMHKLVANAGETIVGVEMGNLTTLKYMEDRAAVGNRYKYVAGKAPAEEGEYTYQVVVKDSEDMESRVTVRLTVDKFLQSPTPTMAWLTWNWFARAINHDKMVEIAKGMKRHGLIDAGFNTIVLDDAWAVETHDKNALTFDPHKFPQGVSGLKTALQTIHKDLKVGIYSDAGSMTCENYQPGSFGHEAQHLMLFDRWGVDMLKYDYCNSQGATQISYAQMGREIGKLNAQRKEKGQVPFVYNICEWGKTQPWTWGTDAGGSSWRATSDVREDWTGNNSRPGVLAAVDEARSLWMYAGVNRFNDLDMMCVGLHGLGGPSNNTANHQSNGGTIAGLTDAQARTQMSLWCMLSSPLSLTCDLRENPKGESNPNVRLPNPLITKADVETLTNPEIIAINQDTLGQQAEYMEHLSTGKDSYVAKGYDVYVKDLTKGRMAVAVTNRENAPMEGIELQLKDLYLDGTKPYRCHDVWTKEDKTVSGTLAVGNLAPCETRVVVLTLDDGTNIKQATAANTPLKSYIKTIRDGQVVITNNKNTYDTTGKLLR